jgi:hypothetical protein
MPLTVVRCSTPGCAEPATHKVAAPWSVGTFAELKTYGFACPGHAEAAVARAKNRPQRRHHLAEGEAVGDVGVYPLAGR